MVLPALSLATYRTISAYENICKHYLSKSLSNSEAEAGFRDPQETWNCRWLLGPLGCLEDNLFIHTLLENYTNNNDNITYIINTFFVRNNIYTLLSWSQQVSPSPDMPQPGTGSHGLFEEFQLGSFPQPARSIQWQFPLHPPEVAPERPRMTVGDMKAWRHHRPLHPHTASKHTKLQRACWATKRRSCGCRFLSCRFRMC